MTPDLHVDYDARPLPASIQELLTAHAASHRLPARQWFTPYTARVLAGRRLLPHAAAAEVEVGGIRLQLYNRAQTVDRSVAHAAGVFARLCIEARASGLPGALQLYAGALVLHRIMLRNCEAGPEEAGQTDPDCVLPAAIPLTVMLFELLDIDEVYAGLREAVVWLFMEVRHGLQGDASLGWLWNVAGGFLTAMRAGEFTGALPDLLRRFGTAAQRAQLLQSALTDNLPLLQRQCEAGLREWRTASGAAPGEEDRGGAAGDGAPPEEDLLQLLGGGEPGGVEAAAGGAASPCGVPVCYCAPRAQTLDLGIKCELRDEGGDCYVMSYALAEADGLLAEQQADGSPSPAYADYLLGRHGGRSSGLIISGAQAVRGLCELYESGQGDDYRARLLESCTAALAPDRQARAGRFRRPVRIRMLRRIQLADGGGRLAGAQAARWMIERTHQQALLPPPDLPPAPEGTAPAASGSDAPDAAPAEAFPAASAAADAACTAHASAETSAADAAPADADAAPAAELQYTD